MRTVALIALWGGAAPARSGGGLIEQVATGKTRVVDLTHVLAPGIPGFPGGDVGPVLALPVVPRRSGMEV